MISMFCPLTNSLKIWISWSHDILSLSDSFTHTQNFNKLFWKTPVVYHFFVLSYCSILFKWWKFNLMSAERNVFLLFNDLICCLVFIKINRTCLKVLHTQSLVSMSTKWAQRWWGEDGKKSLWHTWTIWVCAFAMIASHGWLGPSLTSQSAPPATLPAGKEENRWAREEWHGEEVTSVVVRAERCEDNGPSAEICKAGRFMRLDQSAVKEPCTAH